MFSNMKVKEYVVVFLMFFVVGLLIAVTTTLSERDRQLRLKGCQEYQERQQILSYEVGRQLSDAAILAQPFDIEASLARIQIAKKPIHHRFFE